jgi:hypothetical protein
MVPVSGKLIQILNAHKYYRLDIYFLLQVVKIQVWNLTTSLTSQVQAWVVCASCHHDNVIIPYTYKVYTANQHSVDCTKELNTEGKPQ